MQQEVPARVEETWNLESIFPDVRSWEVEFDDVCAEIPALSEFTGKVLESSERLYGFLNRSGSLRDRIDRLHTYAYLRYYRDTNDAEAKKLLERADTLSAQYSSVVSFFEPEVLSSQSDRVHDLISESMNLKPFRHYLQEIERWRRHTLSPELESMLAKFQPVWSTPENLRTVIHDNEMRFSPIETSDGVQTLEHGTYDQLISNPQRSVRQRVYTSYTDAYIARITSLGEALTAQASASHVFTKVRNFDSTFDAAMFEEGYTADVFWSVVNSCRDHQPLMQRYFRARARLLGLGKIAEYDLMAPLSAAPPRISYREAIDLTLDSLSPLGDKYVGVARQGLTSLRWVDAHPRTGKYSNAFSAGTYLTQPYILMNYGSSISDVGTLTHELGHSMHSLLTNTQQPSCYSNYSMSIAETASNLNQVLLRAHLFKQGNRDLEIGALEEAFYFIHRYLFLMPNLARLEHQLHSSYASDQPMGVADICNCTVEIFGSAYGDTLEYDRERLGTKWAQFGHLYAPFYTYQYAIGISAAMAIGERILQGEAGILERYINFLAAGASMPTLELFKLLDLDFTTPAPFVRAFRVVEGYVERLERLAQESRR